MNPIKRIWDFVFASSDSTLNNALRALVYGVIVAYFVYDYFTYTAFVDNMGNQSQYMRLYSSRQTFHGTKEAILAFIVVSGLLFVRYNKKSK